MIYEPYDVRRKYDATCKYSNRCKGEVDNIVIGTHVFTLQIHHGLTCNIFVIKWQKNTMLLSLKLLGCMSFRPAGHTIFLVIPYNYKYLLKCCFGPQV